jgi:AcrR family transcriptional regulator
MNEVARRADVSPATVSNHFTTPDSLIESVVTRVLADIQVPDSTIFAGTRSVAGRLRVLTSSIYALFERTLFWYELLGAELATCRHWRVPKRRSGTRFDSYTHAPWLATVMICS